MVAACFGIGWTGLTFIRAQGMATEAVPQFFNNILIILDMNMIYKEIRKISLSLAIGLSAINMYGADGDAFTFDGIKYTVLSEAAATAEVAAGNKEIGGAVTIPGTVSHGSNEYKVVAVGSDAFSYNDALTSVVIPEGVGEIKYNAFEWCESLTAVDLPDGLKTISNYAFSGCYKMQAVDFPSTLVVIGNFAFDSCRALTEIVIPDSVTTIGTDAFYNCSKVETVWLGSGVKELGCGSFGSMDSLKKFYIACQTPPAFTGAAEDPFIDTYTATLYVPRGCKGRYEGGVFASIWQSRFKTIKEYDFPVPVKTLTLDRESAEISVDDVITLVATLTPEDATDKTLVWTSSDEKIATVSQTGEVTAIAEGEAVITVKTSDGSNLSAQCVVKVLPLVGVGVETVGVEDGTVRIYTPGGVMVFEGDRNAWTPSSSGLYIMEKNGHAEKIMVR